MKKTLFLATLLSATLGFSHVSWAEDPEYTPLELRNGLVHTKVLEDEHMHISYLDVASFDEHYGKPYLNSQNQIVMNLDNLDGYVPEEYAKDFYRLHLEGFPLILPDGSHSYIKSYMGGDCVISFGHGTSLEGMVEQVDDRDGVKERYSWLTNDIEVREFCSASMSGGYYGGTITMKKAASLTFDMAVIPANVDYEKPNGGAEIIMTGGTPPTPEAIGCASILDMAGRVAAFDLSVSGDWNILTNGTFAGKATITGGELTLNNVTIESNVTFTMANSARLNMGGAAAWLRGFNFFAGTATVDNGTLWLENETATLNTNLSGTYELELRGATLDLNRSVFNNKVIVAGESTITDGEIDNTITILGAIGEREGAKLTLDKTTVGSSATFTMGNGATLDLGSKAQEMSSFELEDSATAYVNNGYLFVDRDETVTLNPNLIGDYKLNMRGGVLNMGDNTLTRDTTVTGDAIIGGGTIGADVYIDSSRKLKLDHVAVGDTATFTMGDGALLNLGEALAGLSKFKFTGETATIDNGTLFVGEGESAKLDADLSGTSLLVLYDGATLDLNDKTLTLDTLVTGNGNIITPGRFEMNITIAEGQLKLSADMTPEASVLLAGNATLNVQKDVSVYDLFVSGTGNKVTGVEDSDTATFAMENAAQLDLDNEKVGLDKFTFGKGTSVTIDNGTLSVTEGTTFTLDANISGTGSKISLETDSRLNVGDFGLLIGCGVSGNGTIVKEMSSTASVSGSMQDFSGSVEVQAGTLNILNVDEDAGLNVADVTIAADGVLGVYKGSTVAETSEGTLTVTGGHKLTANLRAILNADLVMGGGVEAPAVLDVSAFLGDGGLQMGSTVTLNPGSVLLSDADMDAIGALDFMGKYDLFNGVDGLSLDGTTDFLSELGLADKWVKAADVFANEQFKDPEKDYYLFYSGATQKGGVGGNVGTVYLMQIPEPATSTLSLLALCALAARRRRK